MTEEPPPCHTVSLSYPYLENVLQCRHAGYDSIISIRAFGVA